MESKASRTCAICRQTKPIHYFPKVVEKGRLLEQANICLACRANSGEDEEGGGGKQLQHNRNAKQLQYEMELAAALQKELTIQNNLTHNKDMLGMSQVLENERKKQAAQRELLDLKEKMAKDPEDDEEPNPELAFDTQARREKITRLFSVTRSLTRNYVAANNAKATMQKNFGIFSQIKQKQSSTQIENVKKNNTNKTLLKESSTLFAQPHAVKEGSMPEAEKLANAIREGQKIFNR